MMIIQRVLRSDKTNITFLPMLLTSPIKVNILSWVNFQKHKYDFMFNGRKRKEVCDIVFVSNIIHQVYIILKMSSVDTKQLGFEVKPSPIKHKTKRFVW